MRALSLGLGLKGGAREILQKGVLRQVVFSPGPSLPPPSILNAQLQPEVVCSAQVGARAPMSNKDDASGNW